MKVEKFFMSNLLHQKTRYINFINSYTIYLDEVLRLKQMLNYALRKANQNYNNLGLM